MSRDMLLGMAVQAFLVAALGAWRPDWITPGQQAIVGAVFLLLFCALR